MDFNRIKLILSIIGILACLAVVFIAGRNSVPSLDPEHIIMWDTTRVEVPVPQIIEKVRTEYVYLPSKPQPADTVYMDREVVRVDSVLVAIDMERRVYQDSMYKATVSGPCVADMHPSLDDIEIYSKRETIITERRPKLFRPYISICGGKDLFGIGGGVRINEKVDVDVKYMRVNNNDAFMVGTNICF